MCDWVFLVLHASLLNVSELPIIFTSLDFDEKLLFDRQELEKPFKIMYSKDLFFEGEYFLYRSRMVVDAVTVVDISTDNCQTLNPNFLPIVLFVQDFLMFFFL